MSAAAPQPIVDIRRAGERFATKIDWLDSKHSFSFGHHYDPANTHHGLLLVNNDDIVAPGTGFETHPHRDMEIVTWVLRGVAGAPGLRGPHRGHLSGAGPADERRHRHPALGEERLVARSGGDEHTEPVHFVQMWVVPDEARHRARLRAARDRRRAARAAGSCRSRPGCPEHDGAAAIRIRNRYAALYAARLLRRASTVRLPDAPFAAPVRAARQRSTLGGRRRPGDRATRCASPRPAASGSPRSRPAEILVWEMHATLG